jgi:hypothetical protein
MKAAPCFTSSRGAGRASRHGRKCDRRSHFPIHRARRRPVDATLAQSKESGKQLVMKENGDKNRSCLAHRAIGNTGCAGTKSASPAGRQNGQRLVMKKDHKRRSVSPLTRCVPSPRCGCTFAFLERPLETIR